jgi:hypothetical protein
MLRSPETPCMIAASKYANWPSARRPSARASRTAGPKYISSRLSSCTFWKTGSAAARRQAVVNPGSRPACESEPSTVRSAGTYRASRFRGLRRVYSTTTASMSEVPEQNPAMPAV